MVPSGWPPLADGTIQAEGLAEGKVRIELREKKGEYGYCSFIAANTPKPQ
jgi:hypothetical protein